MKYLFLAPVALLLATSLSAQQAPTPDSISTYFASDFGYGGAIFDLTPNADMELTAMDLNLSARGVQVDVDVYYRFGTSFGFEEDATGWILLDSASATARGIDNPSNMQLASGGPTFLAGQTYGIYVELQNITASNTLRYTNMPSASYSNADITLVTNCAKAAGGITSTTFTPREFNGTVYYNTLDGVTPTLNTVNFAAGQTATIEIRNGTPAGQAAVAYSLVGPGPTPTIYGMVDLSDPITVLPIVVLDASGSADINQALPAAAAGLNVWIQGVDMSGGLRTNSVAELIQ